MVPILAQTLNTIHAGLLTFFTGTIPPVLIHISVNTKKHMTTILINNYLIQFVTAFTFASAIYWFLYWADCNRENQKVVECLNDKEYQQRLIAVAFIRAKISKIDLTGLSQIDQAANSVIVNHSSDNLKNTDSLDLDDERYRDIFKQINQ